MATSVLKVDARVVVTAGGEPKRPPTLQPLSLISGRKAEASTRAAVSPFAAVRFAKLVYGPNSRW